MRIERRQNQKPNSLLDRYGSQMGALTERHLKDAALLAAKQNAEKSAVSAIAAQREAEQVSSALRDEMQHRKQAMADLEHLANHDPLTDLPNRHQFNTRLSGLLSRAEHNGKRVAMMLLDLDNFKNVNDTLGHLVGDQLLKAVAIRLQNGIRAQDMLVRLGGDEFALVQVGLNYPVDAHIQAERLLRGLGEVFEIGDHKLFTGASIGITVFPDDGDGVEQLLQNADMAMYKAKAEKRNNFCFFDTSLNDVVHRRNFLETELRQAIENEELLIYFQPKIQLRTNTVAGAEALVRWPRKDEGMISPEEFIPVAERSGLVNPLGEWMLKQACAHLRRWADENLAPVKVAVNLSAVQFRDRDIPMLVSEMLAEAGVEPALLELEVTESAVMNDIQNAVEVLAELDRAGISLSIDDFGTGYSSMSYLRELPVHRLKIDKSFVSEVDENKAAGAIARAIITMGQAMELEIVAEGVETKAQLEYLREAGCDEVQGYYFGRPMPAVEFEEFIRSWPKKE